VVDAIEAAGGARRGADMSSLNRARVLVDGEQIVVGRPAPVGGPGPAASTAPTGAGPGSPGALVDLNTATLDELDALPEVGPVTAQAILDYRTEHGGFGSVDELLDIEGIGEKTMAKLAPHVTV
jgi:competence protein ComEA